MVGEVARPAGSFGRRTISLGKFVRSAAFRRAAFSSRCVPRARVERAGARTAALAVGVVGAGAAAAARGALELPPLPVLKEASSCVGMRLLLRAQRAVDIDGWDWVWGKWALTMCL